MGGLPRSANQPLRKNNVISRGDAEDRSKEMESAEGVFPRIRYGQTDDHERFLIIAQRFDLIINFWNREYILAGNCSHF